MNINNFLTRNVFMIILLIIFLGIFYYIWKVKFSKKRYFNDKKEQTHETSSVKFIHNNEQPYVRLYMNKIELLNEINSKVEQQFIIDNSNISKSIKEKKIQITLRCGGVINEGAYLNIKKICNENKCNYIYKINFNEYFKDKKEKEEKKEEEEKKKRRREKKI